MKSHEKFEFIRIYLDTDSIDIESACIYMNEIVEKLYKPDGDDYFKTLDFHVNGYTDRVSTICSLLGAIHMGETDIGGGRVYIKNILTENGLTILGAFRKIMYSSHHIEPNHDIPHAVYMKEYNSTIELLDRLFPNNSKKELVILNNYYWAGAVDFLDGYIRYEPPTQKATWFPTTTDTKEKTKINRPKKNTILSAVKKYIKW